MAQYLDYNGLIEYDKLLKQYVGGKVYKHTFTEDDWIIVDRLSTFYITIPQTTHKIKNPYIEDFYIQDKDKITYKKAIPSIQMTQTDSTSVSFRIDVANRINGFLVIKEK